MPENLVDEILRALGLERETDQQRKTRTGCRVDASPCAASESKTRHPSAGALLQKGKALLQDASRRFTQEAVNMMLRFGQRKSSAAMSRSIGAQTPAGTSRDLVRLLQRPEVFNKMYACRRALPIRLPDSYTQVEGR